MTIGYAMWVSAPGALPETEGLTRRLDRMAEQGWALSDPVTGAHLARRGTAGMAHEDGLAVCGMAFLEDRAAILDQLGLSGDSPLSDLGLLAKLRARLGPGFAEVAPGSFSVAVLDRARNTVELWRDPFGIYPAFHVQGDGGLVVGSDIRACLHLAGLPLEPDTLRIASFVRGADIDTARTAFAGLHRLKAGHGLTVSEGPAEEQPYGRLVAQDPGPPADAPARLRDALRQATAARMPRDATAGAMLSGGLDSSTLTVFAADEARARGTAPLPTLSFVYPADRSHDETPHIEAANAQFETEGHRIEVTGPPSLADLGPLIEEQMELFLAPGLQKSRRIYTEARTKGIDILIDGHGGDEAISHGYGRLAELAARRRWLALWRETRGAARVHGMSVAALYLGHLAQYGGWRRGHPVRRVLARLARLAAGSSQAGGDHPGPELVAPGLRARMPAEPAADSAERIDPSDVERRAHLRNLTDPMLTQSFEVLHRSAVAAGVLPQYPFLDRRVVALCIALDPDQKLRDGQTRWILREAMRGVLPETIRTRTDKAEFGQELADSVVAHFRDRGPDSFDRLSAYVDTGRAERLRDAVVAGARQDAEAVRALWRLAVLEQWLEKFADWRDAQAKGRLL